MSKPLGLRTVVYRVPGKELEKARAWYTNAFSTVPYFNEPFYVGFNIGGYELGLQPEEQDQDGVRGSNSVTYWGVEDIQVSYDHFINLGARVHEEPHSVGGPLLVGSVWDPWGNLIGLIYNPEFKISP
ncbi:MAG: VOC family protein [Bacteroidota bacterium]